MFFNNSYPILYPLFANLINKNNFKVLNIIFISINLFKSKILLLLL